jgi:hypothetical protein
MMGGRDPAIGVWCARATVQGFVLCALLVVCAPAFAGSGTTSLAIFDPRADAQVSGQAAARIADEFHHEFGRQMQQHEVWGVELITRDAATSAARRWLKTSAPAWEGTYTRAWMGLLNTNELVSFGALGTVRSQGRERFLVRYEIRDFVLNRCVGRVHASGTITDIAPELARTSLSLFQVYLARIISVDGKVVILDVGPEAFTTGTLLAAYAHDASRRHRSGYPGHGHREDDDHYLGSRVYERYRTATETQDPGRASERKSVGNTGHCDGEVTGLLRIEGFLAPKSYFPRLLHARARVVRGRAVPGGFVRLARNP